MDAGANTEQEMKSLMSEDTAANAVVLFSIRRSFVSNLELC